LNRLHVLGSVGVFACGAFALLAEPAATPSTLESCSQRFVLPCEVAPLPTELTSRSGSSLEVSELETPAALGQGHTALETSGPSSTVVGASAARQGLPGQRPRARGQGALQSQQAAGRIHTRVTGRVLDANGFPLAQVLVASLDPPLRATTNDQGEFELNLDRSGSSEQAGLVIQARREGYVTADRVVVSQEPELELELTLAPRVEEAALTVYLLDAYGGRVTQERVFVTPVGSVDTFSSPTDQDGTCRLTEFSPGPVVVWLRSSPEASPLVLRRLELQPGENQLDLRLP